MTESILWQKRTAGAPPASGSRRQRPLQRPAAGVRREYALFLAALGVVAVHIADDSFLQPEPGTAASDHLVSGLLPLAVLALAAAAYPHLRAGLRVSIALALGCFGIAAGVEGWYYTLEADPSGDDYTGLLAVPAGLLLLCLAAATLWKTRRLDETRRRRHARRFAIGVAGAVVAFEVVGGIVASYVLTHTARPVLSAAHLGAAHEDVRFTTSDGLELAGWYMPSRNGAAVITFPGRSDQTQRHARMLASHGYGVLLFDRRGDGQSEGDPYRWDGAKDVEAALAFLQRQPDVDRDRIGGLGLSLGGELLLEAAAESQPLRAVVSEGAGVRTIREHMDTSDAGKWFLAPQMAVITGATAVFSNHAPPPNLKDLIGQIAPRPVFLIYATHGLGGEDINPTLYAAAGDPKTLWEIPEASHTGGLDARPTEYERRVVGFFDHALREAK